MFNRKLFKKQRAREDGRRQGGEEGKKEGKEGGEKKKKGRKIEIGASLVAQWLRIRLPMQGIWVRALVREGPTCLGATSP